MQQLWRWLFNKNHNINKTDRADIIMLFRKVLYGRSCDGMEESFAEMMQSSVVSKYQNLLAYLSGLYDKHEG